MIRSAKGWLLQALLFVSLLASANGPSNLAQCTTGKCLSVSDGGSCSERSRVQIRHMFAVNGAPIFSMYKLASKRNHGLGMRATIRFSIAASGEVNDASFENGGLHSARLERAIIAYVELLDFGPACDSYGPTSFGLDFQDPTIVDEFLVR